MTSFLDRPPVSAFMQEAGREFENGSICDSLPPNRVPPIPQPPIRAPPAPPTSPKGAPIQLINFPSFSTPNSSTLQVPVRSRASTPSPCRLQDIEASKSSHTRGSTIELLTSHAPTKRASDGALPSNASNIIMTNPRPASVISNRSNISNPTSSNARPSSATSSRSPSTVYPTESSDDISWQQSALPPELLRWQAGTPQEVCKVLREATAQCQAIRASALEALHAAAHHRQESEASSAGSTWTSLTDDRHSFGSMTSLESNVSIAIPRADAQPPPPPLPLLHDTQPQQEKPRRSVLRRLLGGKAKEGESRFAFLAVPPKASTSVIEPNKSTTSILPTILPSALPSLQPSLWEMVDTTEPIVTRECASCFDDVLKKDAVSLTCQHHYCGTCFGQLVSTAMGHENFWPAKCCLQEIPKKTIKKHLPVEELAKFEAKAKEYATPAGDRWYCAKAECGKWFEKGRVRVGRTTVSCTHCQYMMCTFCRGATHPRGERCPSDRGLEATLAEAELEGWRQCYKCHQMVELSTGCRHITCTCKAEFCYTCGAVWQTCRCTEADQQRRRTHLATIKLAAQQAAAAKEAATKAEEAATRAEEAELQAALDAVAKFEREQREAEEKLERELLEAHEREETLRLEREAARLREEEEQIAAMEVARSKAISEHYGQLRTALKKVCTSQQNALLERHRSETSTNLSHMELIKKKEIGLEENMAKYTLDTDTSMRNLSIRHAQAMKETISRHIVDQDICVERLDRQVSRCAADELAKSEALEALIFAQDNESRVLKDQHIREKKKWHDRITADGSPQSFKRIKQQLQQEREAVLKASEDLKQVRDSDWMWWVCLRGHCRALLSDDEKHLLASGGDAPSLIAVPAVGSGVEGIPWEDLQCQG